MTRETKIGLLVGLAFIIVIGILLSDHLTSSTDPPQAALGGAGNGVRQAVGTPGNGGATAPVTVVTPVITPQQPVATQAELTPTPPAVQFVKIGGPAATPVAQATPAPTPTPAETGTDVAPKTKPDDTTAIATSDTPPVSTPVPAAPMPTDSQLSKVAQEHGEQIVSAGDTAPTASASQTYVAQPGDSLSKIAARFYGSGTKTNRTLIAKANPSLLANENMIIAGKTYQIPAATKAPVKAKTVAVAPVDGAPVADATPTVDDSTAKPASATEDKPSKAATDAGYVYTVQPGDNLTRIARDQVGDVHAVAAIQELNPDKLKGANHDVVIAGSKIRLPGKKLARAD